LNTILRFGLPTIKCFGLAISTVAIFAFCATGSSADPSVPTVNVRPPPLGHAAYSQDLVVTGDAPDGTINVKLDGSPASAVTIKNTGHRMLTLTDFSVNTPVIFVPIAPITLAPAASAPFPLLINGGMLKLPVVLRLLFRVRDSTGGIDICAAAAHFNSDELPQFDTNSVEWHMGDKVEPRTIRITKLPVGVRFVRVAVAGDDFTAECTGSVIKVIPKDTARQTFGQLYLVTDPTPSFPPMVRLMVLANATSLPLPAAQGGAAEHLNSAAPQSGAASATPTHG
jgi:hypothetical protein